MREGVWQEGKRAYWIDEMVTLADGTRVPPTGGKLHKS